MKCTTITKIVAYYRLSKPKKGKNKEETIRDAYGLEDQRREVAKFAAERGAVIIGEFTEIETGTDKNPNRPELEKAIRMARIRKATIVVGKQDRLARDAYLILGLLKSKVHFVPVDRPDQTILETQFRAMIDEEEARRISERTKRGMAIAREKGVRFGYARPEVEKKAGHLRGSKQGAAVSCKVRHAKCLDTYKDLIGDIKRMLVRGYSYARIADVLNEAEHLTTYGKPFHAMAVMRVIKMFEKVPA